MPSPRPLGPSRAQAFACLRNTLRVCLFKSGFMLNQEEKLGPIFLLFFRRGSGCERP